MYTCLTQQLCQTVYIHTLQPNLLLAQRYDKPYDYKPYYSDKEVLMMSQFCYMRRT